MARLYENGASRPALDVLEGNAKSSQLLDSLGLVIRPSYRTVTGVSPCCSHVALRAIAHPQSDFVTGMPTAIEPGGKGSVRNVENNACRVLNRGGET
jgi:hypothetical protein